MDDSSHYLGMNYSISVALNLRASDAAGEFSSFLPKQQALIVAAPAAPDGPPAPPPGALEEAMHVAAHFSHPALLIGRQAGTTKVMEELEQSAIFHFAGHAGFGRDGAALFLADGALRQSSFGTAGSRRLDHLQLAVFSACATARQSETSDSRSLVSDFLQAGARNVVASRWNVDSVATEDFMGLFYDSLLSGHTPAEALQAAANSLRQVHARTHPYYWAAFTTFGGV
jgi:CHAT domain-containing protein